MEKERENVQVERKKENLTHPDLLLVASRSRPKSEQSFHNLNEFQIFWVLYYIEHMKFWTELFCK